MFVRRTWRIGVVLATLGAAVSVRAGATEPDDPSGGARPLCGPVETSPQLAADLRECEIYAS